MKKCITFFCTFLLIVGSTFSQNFYKKFEKELSKRLGSYVAKGFKIQNPPVNNFGLATCYVDEAEFGKFECDMFNCINKEKPKEFEKWLEMYGFAGVGSTCSAETFSKSVKSQFVSNLILPNVFKALKIKSDISGTKIRKTNLNFGNFYLRLLRRQPFQDYINSLSDNVRIKQFFYQGRLVITSGDIIVEKISYEIEVKSDIEFELDALIKGKLNQSNDSSNLKFSLNRSGEKKYRIDINSPVVVATLTQIQSGPGIMSDDAKNEFLIDDLKKYLKLLQ